MQVYGAGSVHGPHAINATHLNRVARTEAPSAGVMPQDEVQISPMGRLMEQMSALPEIRSEKVNAIKQMIAQGVYDNDARLDAALDRFLDEIV